jgi:DNA-binding NtrC family response regulator
MVAEGSFRIDLFYRLSAVRIDVPPLRDRGEDIVALARSFLASGQGLDASAEAALKACSWPGNVRELRNAIQVASAISDTSVLSAQDLDLQQGDFSPPSKAPSTGASSQDVSASGLGIHLQEEEESCIREALQRFHGHRGKVASFLGIERTTLWRRMKKYGIE